MNSYESTFVVFEANSYFLELSSVKRVVSLTCLNLKVDEVVIFDRALPSKADRLIDIPTILEHLLRLHWIDSIQLQSPAISPHKRAKVGLLN